MRPSFVHVAAGAREEDMMRDGRRGVWPTTVRIKVFAGCMRVGACAASFFVYSWRLEEMPEAGGGYG